ncbi:MAG: PHP domain-containing protein [bacterium]
MKKQSISITTDAHIHSYYSDGSRSPKKIVSMAKKAGLKLAVLTDHDTVAGTDEFLLYANRAGVITVPGIEITAAYMGIEIHVLGYNINHRISAIAELLRPNVEARKERLKKTLALLDDCGLYVSVEEIVETLKCKSEFPSMLHVFEYFSKKLCQNFFEIRKSFKRGGIAWVPYDYAKLITVSEAVRIITKELGGIAVLAHPGKILKAASHHEEDFHQNAWHFLYVLMVELKREGLVGIETFHPMHSIMQQENFSKLAFQLGFINTGGSDFHGKFKKNNKLGVPGVSVPDFLELMD